MKNLVALNEVIHPELEPGVISHTLLQESYRQGYKGEAGRLKELEKLDYEKIKEMRLEFKNILRVDHLWVLTNLTKLSLNFNKLENIENIEVLIHLIELDLSFNYIEKIENLNTLTKLETLTLFNNLITKIENLENQKNLVILSIGNNKITSLKGIERFRFFDKLKVLNLEGNPVTDNDPNCRIYIASVLPNLRYYKYIYITEEEREEGNNKFVRELRDIANNEEDEVLLLAKVEEERLERIRLANSFINDFKDNNFSVIFWNAKYLDKINLLIGHDNLSVIPNYRESTRDIVKRMYNFGLERFHERKNEIELFTKCTTNGLEASHILARNIIEKFLESKDEINKSVRKQFFKIESLRMQGIEGSATELNEPNEEIERLSEEYHGRIDELWEILMKQEVNLFETMEEAIANLKHEITDMIDNLLSTLKENYNELHKLTINFCEQIFTIIKKMKEHDQIPENVQAWINDRGGIKSCIMSYRKKQLDNFSYSEENLISNARQWIAQLIDSKKKDEIVRNRYKIVEINYFLDQMRELFVQTNNEVQEEMVQEQPEPT